MHLILLFLSLPGFGFSGRPSKPIGPRKIAEILNKLMTKNLEYNKNYMAQGGDWGATIAIGLVMIIQNHVRQFTLTV